MQTPASEANHPFFIKHPFLKKAAVMLSFIFHPLWMYTYILLLLLFVNPYMFGVNNMLEQLPLIFLVFFSTFVVPVISILLMKALGFVKSLEMQDRLDRIGPYIIISIFYVSTYYYLSKIPEIPIAFKMFMLGGVISLFIAFFINNFSKISIHTVGMGGLLAATVITMTFFRQSSALLDLGGLGGQVRISMVTILMVVILLCGIIGTARLFLQAHVPRDLWGGYVVGIFGQILALQIVF